MAVRSWGSWTSRESSVGIHRAAIIKSFFLFFSTLFEKYFSKDIFFLLVRVVVFHIVVMWLVEDTIRVVIAVRVLISDSSCLTH